MDGGRRLIVTIESLVRTSRTMSGLWSLFSLYEIRATELELETGALTGTPISPVVDV